MSTTVLAADLVEMLRCPHTGLTLGLVKPALLAGINDKITRAEGGGVRNRAGSVVREPLEGALVRADGGVLYPIRDGIAVLLIDEAVALPLA